MHEGQKIIAVTYRSLEVYLPVAAVYLVLTGSTPGCCAAWNTASGQAGDWSEMQTALQRGECAALR